jgi:hypothetical protein
VEKFTLDNENPIQGQEQRPCQSDVSQPIDIFDLARIAHVGLPHSPDNCFGAMPTKQRSL